MSTSDQTNTTRSSDNSQGSGTQNSSVSSRTDVGQPPQVSYWSPDSSSVGASTTSGAVSEARSSQRSADEPTTGSTPPTHRSSTSTQPSTDIVQTERARTAFGLEHGGPPASPEERVAEAFGARMAENPAATEQVSSSGHNSRRVRVLH